jgi:subtilisin family serine protease
VVAIPGTRRKYAWVAAGVFPAFSAGNSGSGCSTLGSPGDYQESFGSAAHDSSRNIASFSSRGPSAFGHDPYTKPNISAPGVSICSSVPTNSWSCGYSGTSMASPHTAGAVALLWSCNPSLVGQIDATFQVLQNAANTAPAGNCGAPPDGQGNYTFGYGYLDVLAAGTTACGNVDTGTLNGYVFDNFGSPIGGATVSAQPAVEGNGIQATTDPNGFYTMDLVVGTYDVTASKLNYTPETQTGVTVISGTTVTLPDFILTFLGAWTMLDPLPGCPDWTRYDGEYFPANGMVYFLGGRGGADGGSTFTDIYELDPNLGQCTDTGADMITGISNYTIVPLNIGTDVLSHLVVVIRLAITQMTFNAMTRLPILSALRATCRQAWHLSLLAAQLG